MKAYGVGVVNLHGFVKTEFAGGKQLASCPGSKSGTYWVRS
jgi:hypothetical protein